MSVYGGGTGYLPSFGTGDPCARAEDAARQAGFFSWLVPIVVAISKAETGGTCAPSATCRNCLGASEYSVGPWQINLQAHPEVSEECARDPYCAARAVYSISGAGLNFSPWSAYKSGAYKAYLPAGAEGLEVGPLGVRGLGGGFMPVANPALTRAIVLVTAIALALVAWSLIRRGRR